MEPWIVTKAGVLGGKPCIRGTRISVELVLAVLLLAPALFSQTGGWLKRTEKEFLTGTETTFIRGYGSGPLLDLLRIGDAYYLRFSAPQPTHTTVRRGYGEAVLVEPQELGDEVRWLVAGRSARQATVEKSSRQDAVVENVTYKQGRWPIGCEELRELALGGAVRVESGRFQAEFTLKGFVEKLERVYGVGREGLMRRTVAPCTGEANP